MLNPVISQSPRGGQKERFIMGPDSNAPVRCLALCMHLTFHLLGEFDSSVITNAGRQRQHAGASAAAL